MKPSINRKVNIWSGTNETQICISYSWPNIPHSLLHTAVVSDWWSVYTNINVKFDVSEITAGSHKEQISQCESDSTSTLVQGGSIRDE